MLICFISALAASPPSQKEEEEKKKRKKQKKTKEFIFLFVLPFEKKNKIPSWGRFAHVV